MISILKVIFDDINKAETNLKKFTVYIQYNRRLANFLPKQYTLGNKSGYNDVTLINTLKATLYPIIIKCVGFFADLFTTIEAYITKVRKADVIFRSTDRENYIKRNANLVYKPG